MSGQSASDGATRRIAAFARETQWSDIPDRVKHEAKRSILNGFATALGGCREPAIDKSLAALGRFAAGRDCGLIGRGERADMLLAAFVNAMSANIFDFDDTHPATIIHPTAPVSPALFAHAETARCDGAALLRAFILGGEIECRLGNAVSPYHYARGWHITSTCGVFGAAVGVGALLDLDAAQFGWALANASVQAAGLVETLGTMSKSISVGNAARNGIVSALLAAEGFSGPAAPLEGARGFLPVYADALRLEALVGGLGEVWEIGKNTYKPYPVGVVLNPVMEACLNLHRAGTVAIEDAVWELPFVSAAAAYGNALRRGTEEVPVVAILLRRRKDLDVDALARTVVERLDDRERPRIVRIVASMPTTAGYRIRKQPIRARGVPAADIERGRVWLWDETAQRLMKATAAALGRLRRRRR